MLRGLVVHVARTDIVVDVFRFGGPAPRPLQLSAVRGSGPYDAWVTFPRSQEVADP